MATLPSASLVINEAEGAPATGLGPVVVMACVAQSADSVPRMFASTSDLLAQYLYSPGIDYCSLHFQKTNKPVIFVGMPITTAGVVGQVNNTGVTGTSNISVAVGSAGSMEETQGSFTVTGGGVVGTASITGTLSLDGGESTQNVRVGTASSYVIPNVGLTLNFGPGTLEPGDVVTWNSMAPMWGSTAIATAEAALVGQQTLSRSWLVCGDLPTSTFAEYVETQAAAYASDADRFVYTRAQVPDGGPPAALAKNAQVRVNKTDSSVITFAETPFTATRASGSWLAEGFAVGDMVTFAGTADNNGTFGPITVLTATVMTMAAGLTTEVAPGTATAVGSEAVTFATSTITRGAGSWITDGFAVGQNVTIAGTASNNGAAGAITALTSTVMTFASGLAAEGPKPMAGITVTQTQTFGAWMAAQNSAFASVSAQPRISLAAGRARVQSPITGWVFRRPAAWAASCREYTHDVQIPTFRKSDGPLDGFSITNANGVAVEFDERVNGGGLAALFTVLRSWANGPLGAFVALDLTRDVDGAFLSRTQNIAVADVACTTCQAETENAIGQVLELNADGTGTDASLSTIEERVNDALQIALLQEFDEGPRASSAQWTASRTDVLSTPGSTLNGVLALLLNGTLEQIATQVQVS